ncbi:MAG: transposase [Erysipelotrichaceae bacterium]|nr:transposase [Erysipelotrichaceae bacterium]
MNGKSKTFTPGIIMSLHTFGRSLCWNPHIHCLLTEGGMDQDGKYKKITYICYESLRKSFMKVLLDKMKDYFVSHAPNELDGFKLLVNQLYKKDKNGFYVNAPKMKNQKGKDATVNYIIRYCGRPAMAQSRITAYDNDNAMVDYYYEDHATQEYVEVHEDVITFIKKLVQHIPEEQFKMVRYYGLYATCERSRHKTKIKKLIKRLANRAQLAKLVTEKHYRRSLIQTFNVDPLLCFCFILRTFLLYYKTFLVISLI